ncbi:MAG: gephyrin-like molybdotransferase Glp [Pseudomonadota bacterium]
MFFKVKTSEEVFQILREFGPRGEEKVRLEEAGGRILSQDLVATEDLPGFSRTSMDGYAVKAKDTFGATEGLPALLEVVGEVSMGQSPSMGVRPGQAVKISTGGMMPEGADGVVMIEHCHVLDEGTIEVGRAISPLENVIQPGDDFKEGDTVLKKGCRLRPQDLGVMAGLGISNANVYRRPKVAIISTGDEIIPVDEKPGPSQVRDINSYTLSAFCRQAGTEPILMGLCEDDFERQKKLVEKALSLADTVWISGGSSVGIRDLTLKVLESFDNMEILVHGISISPGKPTIIARVGSRAIFGLPGHTTSAMVVAEVFLAPFLARISGQEDFKDSSYYQVEAEISRNIESASGREDFIRVKLHMRGGKLQADPIFGKSGLISTLVEADGLIRVDLNTEGLYQGDKVRVMIFHP